MNRKPRPEKRLFQSKELLFACHQRLISRRQLLLATAGGSLAAMFPLSASTAVDIAKTGVNADINTEINSVAADPWPVIDAVQQHLFPAEPEAPGARDINALAYLKFVTSDTTLDKESREFITKGAAWLEDMAYQMNKKSFISLGEQQREKVLRRIAGSESGENWLATLMLYIVEALLTDPVYGGNTDQLGWKWLQHIPGYPRPPIDKTFPRLLS
ncbi:MAG: gluconate 2-dehydrogenase subunit 3 family protein [Gammaproteobacteria bacterium]|nr:gluconate 2-dehydrogenase subunit 3 family protein [Gammaproteobacteria bacterium]